MKLLIIHKNSSVGGLRYLYKLARALKDVNTEGHITILMTNPTTDIETAVLEKMRNDNIAIYDLATTPLSSLAPVTLAQKFKSRTINRIHNSIRKRLERLKHKIISVDSQQSIRDSQREYLYNFDCIFYSWPYGIDVVTTDKPVFFIPHDFIFTHSFGFDGFSLYDAKSWQQNLNGISKFVEAGAIPIVSSHYIKNEFKQTFPNAQVTPNIVYLSTLGDFDNITDMDVENVKTKYGIEYRYILFASNRMPHKNLGQLLGAMYYVKLTFPDVKLIIAGDGNGDMKGIVNTPYYMDHTDGINYDVKSVGLLNDDEFAALMKGAEIVINTSLCEAGNGSGLDAWQLGVPVAMSNIEPFKNQMECIGVRAELFDPRNAQDIACKINKLLGDSFLCESYVEKSKQALKEYNWDTIAKQYLDIFENGVRK